MRKIVITAGDVEQEATLNDSATADAIWEALPIAAQANTWGEEIYFGIPVHLDEEGSRETVEEGDLGYWPPGHAFCIFFGRTPLSRGNEVRPASPVNVFGRLAGEPKAFLDVSAGAQVSVRRAEG